MNYGYLCHNIGHLIKDSWYLTLNMGYFDDEIGYLIKYRGDYHDLRGICLIMGICSRKWGICSRK
jgi:hypothetical protein